MWALAVTPDGKTVVSGFANGSVRVWDVATGKERAVLTGHSVVDVNVINANVINANGVDTNTVNANDVNANALGP